MATFVNITPHSLAVKRVDGTFLELPPLGHGGPGRHLT